MFFFDAFFSFYTHKCNPRRLDNRTTHPPRQHHPKWHHQKVPSKPQRTPDTVHTIYSLAAAALCLAA